MIDPHTFSPEVTSSYATGVVDGAMRCELRPQTGDVYLIYPTAYHGFYDDALDLGAIALVLSRLAIVVRPAGHRA